MEYEYECWWFGRYIVYGMGTDKWYACIAIHQGKIISINTEKHQHQTQTNDKHSEKPKHIS